MGSKHHIFKLPDDSDVKFETPSSKASGSQTIAYITIRLLGPASRIPDPVAMGWGIVCISSKFRVMLMPLVQRHTLRITLINASYYLLFPCSGIYGSYLNAQQLPAPSHSKSLLP